jgi:hypothetical protein
VYILGTTGWYSDSEGKIAAWFTVDGISWNLVIGPLPYLKVQKTIFKTRLRQIENAKRGVGEPLTMTRLPVLQEPMIKSKMGLEGGIAYSVDHKGILHESGPEDIAWDAPEDVAQNAPEDKLAEEEASMIPFFLTQGAILVVKP